MSVSMLRGCFLIIALLVMGLPMTSTLAQEWFADPDPILTKDLKDVAGQELVDATDPLRDGSYALSEGLNGIFNEEELQDTGTARERTTNYIKGVINYILGLIGIVALIYLLYHGLIVLTAGSDEEKYNKGMKGMKYAAIAIVGVGVAWFVLSLIFWLIQLITNA